MKLEASSRHSEGYFFEVNSVSDVERTYLNSYRYNLPIITGIPLIQNVKYTNYVRQLKLDIPNQTKTFKKAEVFRDQLQKIIIQSCQ